MKNPNDTMTACSAVSQSTAPPRAQQKQGLRANCHVHKLIRFSCNQLVSCPVEEYYRK